MSPPQAGWYPDPQNGSVARWWDGTQWTSATQSAARLQAHASSYASKPRRRIDDNFGRLALMVQLLLVVVMLADFAVLWGNRFIVGVADDFINGTANIEDATTADRINVVAGIGYVLLIIITGIAFIRWLFVAHASDRMNPDTQEHKSGWAIGGWFVPVLNFWRPFGVTIDLRRGVHGAFAQPTATMWLWWLAVVASLIADRVAAAYWMRVDSMEIQEFGEQLRAAVVADNVRSVLDIVAAVLAVLVVRQLTKLVREAPVVS
jgi:Domain of unknown function (DUF4328)/Protein of unknown function (DUF2510)